MSRLKGANVTSSAAVTAYPCSVHVLESIGTATAGTVTLKDGGSGGTTLWVSETPATAGDSHSVTFPDGGLYFGTDCYCTLANAKANVAFS